MKLPDVQKALDSLNHTILCDKRYAMDFDRTLFKSNLSERKNVEKCEVYFNGQVIKGQINVKYLGVLIDQECILIPCQ